VARTGYAHARRAPAFQVATIPGEIPMNLE
jgi:hypothetical protein